MEQLIQGFCFMKSFGALQVSLHDCLMHVTFKSSNDAFHFRNTTCGAEMDSEFTVRVELNTFLGSLDKATKAV
jgi:hypothetical protein